MKGLLSIITIIAFFNCNNKSSVKEVIQESVARPKGENVYTKLNAFVKAFMYSNPNMANNNILQEEGEAKFITEFSNKLNEGLLSDIPLTLLSIHKEREKNKATWTAAVIDEDSTYNISFFADSYISDSIARQLIDFSQYDVKGKFSRKPDDKRYHGNYSWEKGFKDIMGRLNDGIKVVIRGVQIKVENVTPIPIEQS